MTSKEAIERIKDDIEIGYLSTKHDNEKDKYNYLILLKNIEKDLEVLEMLKNKVCFIEKINPKFWLDKDVYNETCNYDYYKWVVKEYDYSVKEEKQLTQEEFNLLKEWLENE